MKKYLQLGKKIKKIRAENNKSLKEMAGGVRVDRTYLSKLESGKRRPSFDVLNKIINYFSLSDIDAAELLSLAEYKDRIVITNSNNKESVTTLPDKKEVVEMDNKKISNLGNLNKTGVQVTVPNNLPVLYTDSVFLTASQFGIVFDFAQNMGPTNQQTIVARVGMSKEHAKALLRVLSKKLIDTEFMKINSTEKGNKN